MLARLFVFFGGLLVLVLTVAMVGPYFIDWTSYRADFEREATAVLGRRVTVEGDATARLLPFPSVTFSDVTVTGGADGRPALTIETFSMDAELAPFIRGEFLIFDMRLVRPNGAIDIAADGTVDWAIRPSAPIGADRISLEKVTITGGQITVRHAASGRTHRLTEIDTQLSARSLHGPWRIGGTLRLDGTAMAVSVSTGRTAPDGTMRLRVDVDPARYPAALEADGNVRLEDGAVGYSGIFKLRPKQAAGEDGAARAASGAPPPYRLGGSFTLDHQRLAVDEFLFETGPLDNPYSAEGRGSIELGAEPRFALSLDGAQIRFDEAVGGNEMSGRLTFADRLAALEAALVELPRPVIPGRIEVGLPAVVAGDTTVRDVRLSAEPVEGGWILKSFAATLPGRATLEAGGKLRTEGELGFAGYMLLAVAQPSGFAAWLARDVDDAIRRLPAAGFQARVDLTANRQTFTDLELALGDATFRGKADSRQPEGARPATLLELSGGALDVDGLAAFASLFVSDEGASRFADRDLDLEVEAGPVSVAGLTAETVDTAMRMRDGRLEIDRLSIGGLAGATISATGRLEGFPARPSGNVDASVVAVDLAPLIEAAAERFHENPFLGALRARAAAHAGLFEDARIDIIATAAADDERTTAVAASAQGTAGGTSLDLTLSAKGTPEALGEAELEATLLGRNDDAGRLLALYGLPVLPLGLTGPAETSLSLKGSPAEGIETTASIDGDGLSAGFTGTVRLEAGLPSAEGKLRLDADDLEPWLMTVGAGLPGMGLGLPVTLEAEAGYGGGRLSLADIAGTVDEGAVAGGIDVDMKEGKPYLTGQLTLDVLDLEPLAAMVLGEESLHGGEQAWPAAPFQPGSTAPFGANLGIEAATLAVGPLATASDARLALRLDGEGLRVADLSARLFGGEASGLLELKNNAGTGLLSGQLKLAGADLEQAMGKQALSGTIDVSAALTASGKSIGGLVAGLSGSGTAALEGLAIAGVNPDALAGFIRRADAIGKDIDAARTAAFVPGIAADGSFRARPVEVAFTVAGGVLRAPPIKLEGDAASIEADVAVDLNRHRISASGAIAYRAGDEALVGSEPVLRFAVEGPAASAERRFDSEPLAQFLMQRALEIEQARVEAMQAGLLEKQRLRREARYYAALQSGRERAAMERRRLEEEARQRAEQERLEKEERAREAAEQAQRDAEARQAAEQAQRDADAAEARQAAEEAARAEADRARQRRAAEAPRQSPQPEIAPPDTGQETGLPGVAADPLARDTDDSPKPRTPFSIQNLLRSLQ